MLNELEYEVHFRREQWPVQPVLLKKMIRIKKICPLPRVYAPRPRLLGLGIGNSWQRTGMYLVIHV